MQSSEHLSEDLSAPEILRLNTILGDLDAEIWTAGLESPMEGTEYIKTPASVVNSAVYRHLLQPPQSVNQNQRMPHYSVLNVGDCTYFCTKKKTIFWNREDSGFHFRRFLF